MMLSAALTVLALTAVTATAAQASTEGPFYKIAGAGHSGSIFYTEMMQAAVQAFFDRHLKPRPNPVPQPP